MKRTHKDNTMKIIKIIVALYVVVGIPTQQLFAWGVHFTNATPGAIKAIVESDVGNRYAYQIDPGQTANVDIGAAWCYHGIKVIGLDGPVAALQDSRKISIGENRCRNRSYTVRAFHTGGAACTQLSTGYLPGSTQINVNVSGTSASYKSCGRIALQQD